MLTVGHFVGFMALSQKLWIQVLSSELSTIQVITVPRGRSVPSLNGALNSSDQILPSFYSLLMSSSAVLFVLH